MAQHDYILENNPGRAVRTDFNNAIAALVSNNSGVTEPANPYPGMLWLDLSVLPDGLMRQRNQSNSGWNNMSGVAAPANGADAITGTDDVLYVTPVALEALTDSVSAIVMNRLVNPAMQIAQEITSGSNATGAQMFIADQWQANGVNGTQVTVSQQAVKTPRGSPNRIRLVATAAKPGLATGDTVSFSQNIEGLRVADLGLGTAKAKQVIARFGFKGPAGTYTFALRQASNRSYLHPFTISAGQANTDTEQVIVIPADVAGTWPVDNTASMQFVVNVGCGATYVNAAINSWIAGNWLGAAGGSNGIAVAGATFELFDCGIYEDVSGIGTPPRWQYPDINEQLLLCQRYYIKDQYFIWCGIGIAAFAYYGITQLPVDLRTNTPSLSGVNSAVNSFPAPVGTLVAMINDNGTVRAIRENRTCSATLSGAYFATLHTANARM